MAKRSKSVTVTTTGASSPIPIDLTRFHGGIGIICTLTGSGVYAVEVTGDPPNKPFVNWNKHDLLQNLVASQNGNLAFPVTGVRLNPSVLNGTLTMTVVSPIGTA